MPEVSDAVDAGDVSAEERRSFDRLINFTDAVVAIGITLQLLPLIDVPGPQAGETVWEVLSSNSGQIAAFALSFVVVIVMWATHNRVFNVIRRYDGTIFTLNLLWLVAIVFLPWPTAMYGEAVNSQVVGAGGVGILYWWNLAVISGLGSLIAVHAWRNPSLLEPGALERHERSRKVGRMTGLVYFLAFIVIGITAEFLPSGAAYLAFALIPINYLLRHKWAQPKGETA
jgi:uncharacterized membrane protein